MKPWSAEHAAGPITRPLREGINVLVLWSEAFAMGTAQRPDLDAAEVIGLSRFRS